MSSTEVKIRVTLNVLVDDAEHCSGECPFLGDYVGVAKRPPSRSVVLFRCNLFRDTVEMNNGNGSSDDRIRRLNACIAAST